MTSQDTQQGWRLAAIGTLGLVLLIGGLGTAVALRPTPRPGWRPDSAYRASPPGKLGVTRVHPLPEKGPAIVDERGNPVAGIREDRAPATEDVGKIRSVTPKIE